MRHQGHSRELEERIRQVHSRVEAAGRSWRLTAKVAEESLPGARPSNCIELGEITCCISKQDEELISDTVFLVNPFLGHEADQ